MIASMPSARVAVVPRLLLLCLVAAAALAVVEMNSRLEVAPLDGILLMSNLRRQVSANTYWWPPDRYTNPGGEYHSGSGHGSGLR